MCGHPLWQEKTLSKPARDLVLYNARVLTMDTRRPTAELVAVRADRITWVGRNDDLAQFRGRARLIDCEGRAVLPGFNDAHVHVMAYAAGLLSIDCSPAAVASISDIKGKIGREARRVPPGTWIKGNGYNEFYLAERRHPTRRDLDEAAPYHPVKLTHRSLHACVLNSAALSLAGITIETPAPPGGLIDRELPTGEPSGLLFGMNSYINEQVVPPWGEGELLRGVKLANQSFLSSGITSLQDATVSNGVAEWRNFLELKRSGALAPRVTMMFGRHALVDITNAGLYSRCGDDSLRLGAVKLVLDEVRGALNPPQEEVDEGVLAAHRAGFQVAIHAVEEGTVGAAATALERCLKRVPGADHRHRIEHCSVCPPPLLERLKAIGAIVVTQPAFIYYSGERYLNEVPDTQRPWLYRTRSFLESGLHPAGSSDCPVSPCSPLVGVYAAVTRKAESGRVLSPEEAVSAREALKLYTLGGAYASFEEQQKGSIEVGRLADLIVLSADPTAVEPQKIGGLSVEKTIVGGEIVWER